MKKDKTIFIFVCLFFCILVTSCREKFTPSSKEDVIPAIFPDYAGVTIPVDIAPLNFTLTSSFDKLHAVLRGSQKGEIQIEGKKSISLPEKKWKELLVNNLGNQIDVTVSVKQNGKWTEYQSFPIYVSHYPIDYGLVYRLVAPGYEVYSKMGIYQRKLSDFTQTALIENTLIPGSCVNCHSFKETDPEHLNLHIRGTYGGTVLQTKGNMDILDFKTEGLISGVYPYWHPSSRYIAYSINKTQQAFHAAPDERIEVVDLESDVIVYDVESNKILSTPLLRTEDFETFPAFSPDGTSLYFCVATKRELPMEYKDIQYDLCRIDFYPETGTFGQSVDTLVHAAAIGKSVSFPRPSYDGKYVMYTLSDYGNFSIWHREADLWLINLDTGENRELTEVNSDDTESYHSWSNNSHWFVFSSRRNDGLYTQPYIASIDGEGKVTKPFLLPQKDPTYYQSTFYSFNIPEFINAPVQINAREVEHKALSGQRKHVN